MRTRLRYLALAPSTPRRVAQRLSELVVLLLAIATLIGVFQLPGLVLLGLGVDAGAL